MGSLTRLDERSERSVYFDDEGDDYRSRDIRSNVSRQNSTINTVPASEMFITSTKLGSLPCFIIGHRVHMRYAYITATILEDALTILNILGECNNIMCNYKMQIDMEQLRDKKFGVTSPKVHDELVDIDLKDLECDKWKIQKSVADRKMCFTVLANTYTGLVLKRSYKALVKYRNIVEDRINYCLRLVDEEAKNKISYRELKKQVRQQRNRNKSAIYETNAIVERLISDYEDSSILYNCRARYDDNWERSLTEQHSMQIKEKETKYSNLSLHYRIKADEEQRIHTEVEEINKIRVSEILKQLDECMKKYEKDIDVMDMNITIKRINFETQLETSLEIEQKLADHNKEIQKWVQFKVEREHLRVYQDKMVSAAIIVQAWWRGLLVRLALGPFKRISQKKNKKKKKKI